MNMNMDIVLEDKHIIKFLYKDKYIDKYTDDKKYTDIDNKTLLLIFKFLKGNHFYSQLELHYPIKTSSITNKTILNKLNLIEFIIYKYNMNSFESTFITNINSNILKKLQKQHFFEHLVFKIFDTYSLFYKNKQILDSIFKTYKKLNYNFNYKNADNKTIFHIMCENNFYIYADKLLKIPLFTSFNDKDKNNKTAYDLSRCKYGNNTNIIKLLINNKKINSVDNENKELKKENKTLKRQLQDALEQQQCKKQK